MLTEMNLLAIPIGQVQGNPSSEGLGFYRIRSLEDRPNVAV